MATYPLVSIKRILIIVYWLLNTDQTYCCQFVCQIKPEMASAKPIPTTAESCPIMLFYISHALVHQQQITRLMNCSRPTNTMAAIDPNTQVTISDVRTPVHNYRVYASKLRLHQFVCAVNVVVLAIWNNLELNPDRQAHKACWLCLN